MDCFIALQPLKAVVFDGEDQAFQAIISGKVRLFFRFTKNGNLSLAMSFTAVLCYGKETLYLGIFFNWIPSKFCTPLQLS